MKRMKIGVLYAGALLGAVIGLAGCAAVQPASQAAGSTMMRAATPVAGAPASRHIYGWQRSMGGTNYVPFDAPLADAPRPTAWVN